MESTPLDAQDLQMVPSEEAVAAGAADTSPKRPRMTTTLAAPSFDDSFWARIQETVTTAVATTVRPLQDSLAAVASRAEVNERSLSNMQARFDEHVAAAEETDRRVTARLEALQGQVLDLQKGSSPSTSPSARQPDFHAVPPVSPTARSVTPFPYGGRWLERWGKEELLGN